MIEWVLYVMLHASINGYPVHTLAIVEGPVTFSTAEDCVARGRRWKSAETTVICDPRGPDHAKLPPQVEVK